MVRHVVFIHYYYILKDGKAELGKNLVILHETLSVPTQS